MPEKIDFNIDKKHVKLVYFSGTGGTARVVSCIDQTLTKHGINVHKESLDKSKNNHCSISSKEHHNEDLLIMVFAVHAFDAPKPVYDWIKNIQPQKNTPAVVISVSGGGEVWPNTACRSGCIRALQRKGFNVFYEQMIVMPSNWIMETKEQLAVRLLKILPLKIENIASEILSGVIRRSKPQISAKMMAAIFKLEKPCAKLYAKDLGIRQTCTGCGWCANNCPTQNIEIINSRPKFGWKCIICLRCVYGCPSKSIFSRFFNFVVIKRGYDLSELEKRIDSIELEPVEKHATGYLYAGVRDYLLSDKS